MARVVSIQAAFLDASPGTPLRDSWCQETGDPIGMARLLANPTASLTVEAQQRREARARMFGT